MSFWKAFSHEFSSWLTGRLLAIKAVDIYCVFSLCLIIFLVLLYDQRKVIPEWLGSILKRATAFFYCHEFIMASRRQFFFSGFPVTKVNSGSRHESAKQNWLLVGGSAIINGRFVLITLCLGMVYAPNKGKGIETHLPDVHSLGT